MSARAIWIDAALAGAALAGAALAGASCSHKGNGGSPDAAATADAAPPDATVVADALPTGAISFFLATGCPSGWAPYGDAAGRTIVPTTTDPKVTAGAALAPNEDRAHHHDVAVGVDLSSISFVGAAGGGNNGVAAAGHVDATVTTADGAGGVPYVQLLACAKTAPPSGAAAPSGLVAFFDGAACPAGWSAAPDATTGRMLVGLPAGATPGTTFGGAPLASGEVRTHTHAVTGTLAVPTHGLALASGCCASGYAAAGQPSIIAQSGDGAVDVPYLQLRACVAP